MHIFFAVNNSYIEQLCVAMVSILENNRRPVVFHIMTAGFSPAGRAAVEKLRLKYDIDAVFHEVDDKVFAGFNINIEYITKETYFRYLIADMAPDLDRCLYLDADLVVNGDISEMYDMPLDGYYAAGVRDILVDGSDHKAKIGMSESDMYANAGVLLLNLAQIRKDGMVEKLFQIQQDMAGRIKYQDQDVINIAFRGKVAGLPETYNQNRSRRGAILHYFGPAKPWQWHARYKTKSVWLKYARMNKKIQDRTVRVGLIIDEFFGAAGTAFGGYGFLARKYVAKYIPKDGSIEIDVLLGRCANRFTREKEYADSVCLYRLPRYRFWARRWLRHKNYDVYLSIELVDDWVLKNGPKKKLILWIQDPRPKYEWDEIETVKLFPESSYYTQRIYNLAHELNAAGLVRWVSQGYFLNPKARDLYNIPAGTQVQYLPNPVDIDCSITAAEPKKNQIIFLGRIESVKRGWLFCEIAKALPEYEFFVLGQAFREKDKNNAVMSKYKNIPNLCFAGHVDGEEKERFLRESKILVNTSIHEALPVSFLEALACGTVLVSNRNPENLTARFGIWTGDILGDGFDKVPLFVNAVKKLMTDDALRREKSDAGIEYVRRVHNVPRFVADLRRIVYQEAAI